MNPEALHFFQKFIVLFGYGFVLFICLLLLVLLVVLLEDNRIERNEKYPHLPARQPELIARFVNYALREQLPPTTTSETVQMAEIAVGEEQLESQAFFRLLKHFSPFLLLLGVTFVLSGKVDKPFLFISHLFNASLPPKIAIGSVVFSTLLVWAGLSHWKLPQPAAHNKFISPFWLIRAGFGGVWWVMAEWVTVSMYTVQSQDPFTQSYYDYEFTHSLFIVGSAMIMAILALHLVEDKPVSTNETV